MATTDDQLKWLHRCISAVRSRNDVQQTPNITDTAHSSFQSLTIFSPILRCSFGLARAQMILRKRKPCQLHWWEYRILCLSWTKPRERVLLTKDSRSFVIQTRRAEKCFLSSLEIRFTHHALSHCLVSPYGGPSVNHTKNATYNNGGTRIGKSVKCSIQQSNIFKLRVYFGGNIVSYDVARPWRNAATCIYARRADTKEIFLKISRNRFVSATNVSRVAKRLNILEKWSRQQLSPPHLWVLVLSAPNDGFLALYFPVASDIFPSSVWLVVCRITSSLTSPAGPWMIPWSCRWSRGTSRSISRDTSRLGMRTNGVWVYRYMPRSVRKSIHLPSSPPHEKKCYCMHLFLKRTGLVRTYWSRDASLYPSQVHQQHRLAFMFLPQQGKTFNELQKELGDAIDGLSGLQITKETVRNIVSSGVRNGLSVHQTAILSRMLLMRTRWNAKFFIVFDVYFLVRLRGKFEVDHY